MASDNPQQHWRHAWPCTIVLSEFLCANDIVAGKYVLELGSGASGVVGLTAAKLGASKVYMTDVGIPEIFPVLRQNVAENGLDDVCRVMELDWKDQKQIDRILNGMECLDYVVASDVFYDPVVFESLVKCIGQIIRMFPKVTVYFSYQERDDNWSCVGLLRSQQLRASLVRRVDVDGTAFQIGLIAGSQTNTMFGGIEGGGTSSKLVLVDASGEKRFWSSSVGSNYYLDGVEVVGDRVAHWIRKEAAKHCIQLPLKALGMGLSGAEDDLINNKFVQYLMKNHGDIAEHIDLSSDAVCTVAANFSKQGVVLIAGTGSSCRMLTSGGSVKGCGGWGHAFGDGGSAYWIANRAIRMLFDDDDGLEPAKHSTEVIRSLLCGHFDIEDKVGILDYLYKKFEKPTIAKFTSTLATRGDDPAVAEVFFDGGYIIGRHVIAVCGPLPKEEKEEILIVLVGKVFNSWSLLKPGFLHALQGTGIHRLKLFLPSEEPAIGAAVIGARKIGIDIPHATNKQLIESIDLQ